MNHIDYKSGDQVGSYGCVYVRESEKRNNQRRAIFICGGCNHEFNGNISQVSRGEWKSCGCRNKIPTYGNLKHGLLNDRLYKKWKGIKRRCYNSKEDSYYLYGGRGIKMCDEWLNDPKIFVDYCKTLDGWDDLELTIDRIESNKDYEPDNIRFTTNTIQARNMRKKKNNTSGYTGAHRRGNRFKATIGINYKIINLGNFDTVLDAAKARDQYIIDNNLDGFNLQILSRP